MTINSGIQIVQDSMFDCFSLLSVHGTSLALKGLPAMPFWAATTGANRGGRSAEWAAGCAPRKASMEGLSDIPRS